MPTPHRPFTSLSPSPSPSLAPLLAVALIACGDDEPAGTGGGGDAGTTGAATTIATTTGGTTTGAQGGGDPSGTGTGGAAEGGGAQGGSSADGGASGGEGGKGGGDCADQPPAFALSDIEDPCLEIDASLEEGAFHIEFLDVPDGETFTFEQEIAADYAWEYVIALPIEDVADYELIHTRCTQMAGEDTATCFEGPVEPFPAEAACSVLRSPRFGLDPTNYAEGENHYRIGFTLRRGCAEVSDEFEFTVVYAPQ